MTMKTAALDSEKLLLVNQKQAEMIDLFTQEIKSLKEQVEWLKRQLFGRKSERMEFDPNQLLLDSLLIEAMENSAVPEPATETETLVAAHKQKATPHGRGILPDHLERKITEIDIPEEQKVLPDGRLRPCIGFEESEQLAFIPKQFFVKVTRRLKYGSPVGAEENGVVVAPVPVSLLPRCFADETVISYVIVSKFGDHLPIYRLMGIMKRSGIDLARQTACDWVQGVGLALDPVVKLYKKELFAGGMVHNDDTPVDLLEENQKKPRGKKIRTARFWVSCSPPRDGSLTVFNFTVSREADGPREFFKDYKGKMICDAYAGYDLLDEDGKQTTLIVLYGCWAHTRRYFFDAYKGGDPKLGAEFLALIKVLYAIEKKIKDKDDDERLKVRRESSAPVLDAILKRVDELFPVTPPKSLLGKALQYTKNNWERLIRFVDDPQAGIDNNPAENAIRPVALGRKNWLFIGNERSGHAAANIMSVIATCKKADIDPYVYLLDVMRRLPTMEATEHWQLLPDEWKRARKAATQPSDAQP